MGRRAGRNRTAGDEPTTDEPRPEFDPANTQPQISCMSSPNSPLEPTLLREYYFSPEIFGKEKERIFFGQWMCVGREEEAPNPGDYLLLDLVGESVILVRTREGKLAAHYNVCRHRGSQLVLGVSQAPPLDRQGVGRQADLRPLRHLHQRDQVSLPLL